VLFVNEPTLNKNEMQGGLLYQAKSIGDFQETINVTAYGIRCPALFPHASFLCVSIARCAGGKRFPGFPSELL